MARTGELRCTRKAAHPAERADGGGAREPAVVGRPARCFAPARTPWTESAGASSDRGCLESAAGPGAGRSHPRAAPYVAGRDVTITWAGAGQPASGTYIIESTTRNACGQSRLTVTIAVPAYATPRSAGPWRARSVGASAGDRETGVVSRCHPRAPSPTSLPETTRPGAVPITPPRRRPGRSGPDAPPWRTRRGTSPRSSCGPG